MSGNECGLLRLFETLELIIFFFFIIIININTYWAPNLGMSPELFTVATESSNILCFRADPLRSSRIINYMPLGMAVANNTARFICHSKWL